MTKKKVLEWGMQRRGVVIIDDEATKGATVGENLFNADGTLYDPEVEIKEVAETVIDSIPSFFATIWRLILEIPANIISLAALTGIGFATRINAASEWTNRTIIGIGRILVEFGDGVGTNIVTLNSGGDVTLNSGGDVTLNSLFGGDPIIRLLNPNYVAVTGAYDVLVDDDTVNATSGTFVETLPTAIGVSGKIYNLKNSGTGVITLETTSGQTIDDEASGDLTLNQYDNLQVQSNGANWIIL